MHHYKSPHRKEFEKAFRDLTYRHDRSNGWSLFLWSAMAYFGRDHFMFPDIAGPCHFQAEYDSEAKRFNADEQCTASRMVAMLMLIYNDEIEHKGWTDYLGEFYTIEILGEGKASALGQFFTPEDVCTIMAKQTIGKDAKVTSDTKILDPSCGSGRTLIASCVQLENDGLFPYYYGVDVDYVSVLMACINFVLHGMRGYVIRGNSLSLEYYTGYFVGGYIDQINPFKRENQCIYPLDREVGREILGTAGAERIRYKQTAVPLEMEEQHATHDILH